MVYSFYTEIKVRSSGIRRNTMIRKNKLRLTLTTALMTAALGFPALASERIEDITLEIESGIHAGEYGDNYAWIYTPAESTADHTCASYGRIL